MTEVGSAFVTLMPSMRGFGAAVNKQAGSELDGAGKTMGSRFGGAIGKFAKVGAIAGLAAVGAAFTSAFKAAAESERITAATAAVLKSTGGAANVTADQVNKLGNEISAYSGIADESVREGQNLLLTFTKVRNEAGKGNDVFTQATKSIADMSVALGTDMKGAALQVGKALNDPTKGVTALTRAGVSFTQQQKDQIKAMQESGNMLGAQKLILSELETQFGGAAKAAGDTFTGSINKLKNAFGDTLRDAVAPMLPKLTEFALLIAERLPGALNTAITVSRNFVEALRPMGETLFAIGGFVSRNRDFFIPFLAAITAGAVAIKTISVVTKLWAVAQGILNAVLTANPIGIVVVALAALVAGLVVAYKRSETFRNIVNGAWSAIRVGVTAAVNGIKAVVTSTWNVIRSVTSAAWNAIKNTVLVPVRVMLALLQGDMGKAKSIVSDAWNLIKALTSAAWNGIKTAVSSAVTGLVGIVKGIPGKVTSALGNLGSLLYDKGRELIQGLIDGVKSMLGAVGDIAGQVAGKIGDFFPGSPVKDGPLKKWNNGMAGKRLAVMLADGLEAGSGVVALSSARLAASVASPSLGVASYGTSAASGRTSPTRLHRADLDYLADRLAGGINGAGAAAQRRRTA